MHAGPRLISDSFFSVFCVSLKILTYLIYCNVTKLTLLKLNPATTEYNTRYSQHNIKYISAVLFIYYEYGL